MRPRPGRSPTSTTRVGDVPIRIYRLEEQPVGILVYFHGGGFVLGSIGLMDNVARELAYASGAVVISVEYHWPRTSLPGRSRRLHGGYQVGDRQCQAVWGSDRRRGRRRGSSRGNLPRPSP